MRTDYPHYPFPTRGQTRLPPSRIPLDKPLVRLTLGSPSARTPFLRLAPALLDAVPNLLGAPGALAFSLAHHSTTTTTATAAATTAAPPFVAHPAFTPVPSFWVDAPLDGLVLAFEALHAGCVVGVAGIAEQALGPCPPTVGTIRTALVATENSRVLTTLTCDFLVARPLPAPAPVLPHLAPRSAAQRCHASSISGDPAQKAEQGDDQPDGHRRQGRGHHHDHEPHSHRRPTFSLIRLPVQLDACGIPVVYEPETAPCPRMDPLPHSFAQHATVKDADSSSQVSAASRSPAFVASIGVASLPTNALCTPENLAHCQDVALCCPEDLPAAFARAPVTLVNALRLLPEDVHAVVDFIVPKKRQRIALPRTAVDAAESISVDQQDCNADSYCTSSAHDVMDKNVDNIAERAVDEIAEDSVVADDDDDANDADDDDDGDDVDVDDDDDDDDIRKPESFVEIVVPDRNMLADAVIMVSNGRIAALVSADPNLCVLVSLKQTVLPVFCRVPESTAVRALSLPIENSSRPRVDKDAVDYIDPRLATVESAAIFAQAAGLRGLVVPAALLDGPDGSAGSQRRAAIRNGGLAIVAELDTVDDLRDCSLDESLDDRCVDGVITPDGTCLLVPWIFGNLQIEAESVERNGGSVDGNASLVGSPIESEFGPLQPTSHGHGLGPRRCVSWTNPVVTPLPMDGED